MSFVQLTPEIARDIRQHMGDGRDVVTEISVNGHRVYLLDEDAWAHVIARGFPLSERMEDAEWDEDDAIPQAGDDGSDDAPGCMSQDQLQELLDGIVRDAHADIEEHVEDIANASAGIAALALMVGSVSILFSLAALVVALLKG